MDCVFGETCCARAKDDSFRGRSFVLGDLWLHLGHLQTRKLGELAKISLDAGRFVVAVVPERRQTVQLPELDGVISS